MRGPAVDLDRLDVLRALAEPTRHALYRELAAAPGPLTTGDLAQRLGLHANTVRAHLDQLAAAGLVHADTAARGGRGRPQHRFTTAPAPTLPAPVEQASGAVDLARALVEVARQGGAGADELRRIGRRSTAQVEPAAAVPGPGPGHAGSGVDAVVRHEASRGFAPTVVELGPGRWQLSFGRCPYRDLADEAPEVLCAWHHGAVEGLCARTGEVEVAGFSGAGGACPCQAVLVATAVGDAPEGRYDSTTNKEDPT